MRKLKKFEIAILAGIPFYYIVGYFAFLALTKPSAAAVPLILTQTNSKVIVTGNIPLGNYGVKFFRPAIDLHMKLTGEHFVIRVHELA